MSPNIENSSNSTPSNPQPTTRISGAISLVNPFSGLSTERYKIQDFIINIEEAALLDNWTEPQKCAITRLRLQPPAKDFLETDTKLLTTTDWTTLKQSLLNRFQVTEPYAQTYKQLTECLQSATETAQDYASRLRILGNKTLRLGTDQAENATRRKILEEQLLAQFCTGLKESLRRFVATHNPSTLDEAIAIAQREESYITLQQP